MQKELIIEVMTLGQVNILSNILNTLFSDFIPYMFFFSHLDVF